MKANEGHRAQEWGDLAQPLWKGRLRVVEKSGLVTLLFEDAQTGISCHILMFIHRVTVELFQGNVCVDPSARDLIPEVPIYSIREDTVRPFQAICRGCP